MVHADPLQAWHNIHAIFMKLIAHRENRRFPEFHELSAQLE